MGVRRDVLAVVVVDESVVLNLPVDDDGCADQKAYYEEGAVPWNMLFHSRIV